MGPTIQDISFLLGLHPHGEKFGPDLDLSDISFEYRVLDKPTKGKTKHISAYRSFLLACMGEEGSEVSKFEHIAFLIYWLNKFVFCTTSVAITKEYTALAVALSIGKPIALAPLVWSHLVRGVHDYVQSDFT